MNLYTSPAGQQPTKKDKRDDKGKAHLMLVISEEKKYYFL